MSVVLIVTIFLRLAVFLVCVAILHRLRLWKFDYFVASGIVVGMIPVGRALYWHSSRLVDQVQQDGFRPRFSPDELPDLIGPIAVLLASLVIHRLLKHRKTSEDRLHDSRKRWEQLIDAAPVGVFVGEGSDPRVVYANPAMLAMLGHASADFRVDHLLDPVIDEDRRRMFSLLKQFTSESPVQHLEFRFDSPTNEPRWSHLTVAQMNTAPGAQPRWVCVVTDITDEKNTEATMAENWSLLETFVNERTAELDTANRALREEVAARQKAEDSLRETNSKLHTLMLHVPDLVMTVDRDGTLLFVNHHQRPCFPEIKAGKNFVDYLPERYHAWYRGAVENAFQHAASDELIDLAMETRSWRVRVVPIREEESIASCMLICTETTRRKKAEESLRQRDAELAHVSRVSTVGEMVSGTAHEITQPLAAISNYSSALGHTLEGRHTGELDQIREWNKKIGEQATRAAAIIDGLRGFVANVPSRLSVVDLHDLVREAVELVRVTTRDDAITIELILSAKNSMVRGNPIEITQVVVNLVRNACESVAHVSDVDRRVSLSTAIDGDKIILNVTDNGPGMDEELATQIYDPFFTTKPAGMGMGLAVCRTIVARHHGHLSHISTAARGATFCLTLPLAPKGTDS